jgi:hypothetical protein
MERSQNRFKEGAERGVIWRGVDFSERTVQSIPTKNVRSTCRISYYRTRKAMNVRRKVEARSRNHCCSGTAKVLHILSVCVCVVLVTQRAKRMRRIILSSVACPALPYFSTFSHKRNDFREKVIENKMCVLIFSTICIRKSSHFRKNSARYYHKCAQFFI